MTEKQHCDHECVCGVLMVGGIEGDRSTCDFSGCKHDTRLPHTLVITNTKTGKVFQHENTNHAWNDLAADFKADLIRSDIECLLTDGETWYMLDECGNWAYLPAWYKVEEVR